MAKGCAGCNHLAFADSAKIPLCLEPIVYFGAAARLSRGMSLDRSYQCIACERVWYFSGQRQHWYQHSLDHAGISQAA